MMGSSRLCPSACTRRIFRAAHVTTLAFLLVGTTTFADTSQERTHQMGHRVMPFELSKTMHIFRMTESGGVQRVIAKDPNAKDRIRLIQRHLKYEAERFRRGDYSDPAALHGADMPGLKVLESAGSRIKISYTALPSGAEITFEASDLRLVTAIHRWFGAQLSEHGADATAQ
ncbi:MAG TPA: hypothetical protein PLO69_13195 [Gammaproteobacteria bacterium]|nr:hypothetical protein [Gammaproteobacteria bacterium]